MLRKKIIVLFILVQLFVVISITSIGESDNWPTFSHDYARTGFSTSKAPTNTLRWSDSFDETTLSSPVVVDGKLYFTSDDGNCYCVYASNGTEIWRYDVEGNLLTSPTVSDGYIYVGSDYINIHCLNAENGSLELYFQTDSQVYSSPIIANNCVYVTSFDGTIYSLNKADGIEEWSYSIDGYIWAHGAFTNNRLYIATTENKIYCINIDDRSEEWIYQINIIDSGIRISPTISNDKIYFGADDSKLYCLDAETGIDLWNFTAEDKIWSNPSIAYDKVYFGSNDNKLYCLDINGNEVWNFSTEDSIESSPSISDGFVYAGSNDNYLYCIDAEEGIEQWKRNLNAPIKSSPAIVDGFLYVTAGSSIFCFGENNPPTTPNQPSGETEGFIDEEYTYSTTPVTDPDDHEIYYLFNWGDETSSEWIETPAVSHVWEETGIYEVKVKARDNYEGESDWSDILTVTISTPLPKLDISCPSSVLENEVFTVTVTSENIPIQNVNVRFNDKINITDSEGKVTFTAPEIASNKEYTITATLDGYLEDTAKIIVLNKKDQQGWIYGVITDNLGVSLNQASICAKISGTTISKCDFTDEEGKYVLSLLVGTYEVEINKEGYESATKILTVIENSAVETNFILQAETIAEVETESSLQDELIDYLVQSDKVDVNIDFDSTEGKYGISFYTDDELNIEIETADQELSLTVSASDETPGKLFVLRIDDASSLFNSETLDVDNLIFKFDGIEIKKNDMSNVLDSNGENTPKWTGFFVGDTLVVLAYVPEFSEHTITISSVVAIGSLVAIGLYILFCGILAFVLGSPIIFGPHRTYFKKKRGR